MNVQYRTHDGHVIECEVGKVKDAFEFLAAMGEAFGVTCCGHCKSENIKRVYRKAKGFSFYELRCNECHYRLEFGVLQENERLFPRRKDKDTGEWIDHDGWFKWDPDKAPATVPAKSKQSLPDYNDDETPF